MSKATMSYWQKKYGYDWRGNKASRPHKRDTRQLDYYASGTTDEIIEQIKNLASGLEDARWEYEMEYGPYGESDRSLLSVTGWREATDEEISLREAELSYSQSRQDKAIEEAEALLRKTKPELFK